MNYLNSDRNAKSLNAIILCVLVVLFLFTQLTHAQTEKGISLLSTNSTPAAGEEVVLTIFAENFDIELANVTWYKDGQRSLSGIGEDKARFRVGSVGQTTTVAVEAELESGDIYRSAVSYKPQGLDVLWQADSYVPPFYAGKALSASGGLVHVTAIPEIVNSSGEFYDSKVLDYSWRQNGILLGNASGIGKERVTLEGGSSVLNPLSVNVTVTTPDTGVQVTRSIVVPTAKTHIVFYEASPLEGVLYNKAIQDGYDVLGNVVVIEGEPYNFSIDDYFLGRLNYEWRLNGTKLGSRNEKLGETMEFRTETLPTDARITLDVINENLPFRVFQEAKKVVNIIFN